MFMPKKETIKPFIVGNNTDQFLQELHVNNFSHTIQILFVVPVHTTVVVKYTMSELKKRRQYTPRISHGESNIIRAVYEWVWTVESFSEIHEPKQISQPQCARYHVRLFIDQERIVLTVRQILVDRNMKNVRIHSQHDLQNLSPQLKMQ